MNSIKKVIVLISLFFLQGCFLKTSLAVTLQGSLHLKSMQVNIDTGGGPALIEASIVHSMNLLGLRDRFQISSFEDGSFKDNMLIRPVNTFDVKGAAPHDNYTITEGEGGLKTFVWKLEPRSQDFADEARDSQSKTDTFLIFEITFPGPVEMANSQNVTGNTVTWNITREGLTSPVELKAFYRVGGKEKAGGSNL